MRNRICHNCGGPLPASRKLICEDCDQNTPDWVENFETIPKKRDMVLAGASVVFGVTDHRACGSTGRLILPRSQDQTGTDFTPQTEGKGR